MIQKVQSMIHNQVLKSWVTYSRVIYGFPIHNYFQTFETWAQKLTCKPPQIKFYP